MFIAHPQLGFYSVVVPKNQRTGAMEPDRRMVRARRRADLERLKERYPVLAEATILESPAHADYRWRLLCERDAFAQVMQQMAEQIDYANVKAESHRHDGLLGVAFSAAMHASHAAFARLQVQRADDADE